MALSGNAAIIATFLASKGLTAPQIAGVLGNLQIESGFSPTAFNSGEGAIGIAQWEGGRRTALQQFASRMGTSETSLSAQLNFLWSELTGSESAALSALRATHDPTAAATVFDQSYERSAGTSRAQRIAAALAIFAGGIVGGSGSPPPPGTGGTTGQPVSVGSDLFKIFTPFGSFISAANPNAGNAVGDAINGIGSDIATVFNAFLSLFRPSFWLRVGAFVFGLFLLVGGFIVLKGAV